jgi:uncharacterized protein YecE (DUF72 family)
VLVGTSGWSYATWRGGFYPHGVASGDWLAHYASVFPTVELNASFYRLPSQALIERWTRVTPDGFVFAVKASRLITHSKRLKNCEEAAAAFLDRTAGLGPKLGPILFQLPPRIAPDLGLLEAFLASLPKGPRYAFEFRDPRWHIDDTYAALSAAGAAFCPFELGEMRGPRIVTADFVYVRLHGRKAPYQGAYSKAALTDWASWLDARRGEGLDGYVYFDNTDVADDAVRDAQSLTAMLDRSPQARPSRRG